MKSISKLTIGSASAEFGKKRLAKEISSKNDEQDTQQEKPPVMSREDILSIPDEDYEFMQKIAGNVKFMPSDKGESFKYNSLVNHGYFQKEDNDEYKPTEKGSEIISALKSIYHS
ncbi:MAG: hypothetical protein ACQESN_10585 [Thermotogota bacterium]